MEENSEDENNVPFDEMIETIQLSNGWLVNIEFVEQDDTFEVGKEYVLAILNALKEIIELFGIPQLHSNIYCMEDTYEIVRLCYLHEDKTLSFDLK